MDQAQNISGIDEDKVGDDLASLLDVYCGGSRDHVPQKPKINVNFYVSRNTDPTNPWTLVDYRKFLVSKCLGEVYRSTGVDVSADRIKILPDGIPGNENRVRIREYASGGYTLNERLAFEIAHVSLELPTSDSTGKIIQELYTRTAAVCQKDISCFRFVKRVPHIDQIPDLSNPLFPTLQDIVAASVNWQFLGTPPWDGVKINVKRAGKMEYGAVILYLNYHRFGQDMNKLRTIVGSLPPCREVWVDKNLDGLSENEAIIFRSLKDWQSIMKETLLGGDTSILINYISKFNKACSDFYLAAPDLTVNKCTELYPDIYNRIYFYEAITKFIRMCFAVTCVN